MPFPDAVLEKLKTLPASPGVYVFRDGDGQVLYVGKAASLRSRVRSYFQAGTSDTRLFIGMLEGRLTDIETLVVRTEKEAVLLENQLIKELKPLWNVKLRDDKEFLSLRLRTKEPWPRLEVVRRPEADGARYFGPYHSATAARQTLRLVNRHFQLRTCTDTEMRSRKRPCLQYQIKRCPAPCVLDVDRAAYGAQVEAVSLFLDGRHDELVEQVESQMATAAERTEYELAAMYRDQMRAIEAVRESQRVAHVRDVDQDVLGLHRQADQAELAVVRLRRGRVVRVDTYALRDVNSPDDEILAAFLRNSYEAGTYVPHEVVLPLAIEAEAGLGALLSELRGGRVDIVHPKRGARNELVQLATDNARHAFEEKARAREDVERRLGDVQARLELPTLPRRIECIDVSHTGGEETVATIVALLDGAPDRDGYRSFRVRTVSGGDDYGAMHEVLGRRLRRGRDAESGWQLPDLLVVDGGRGQLNVALAVLKDLGVEVPVVGLAKEKESRATGELFVDRVYVPGAKNAIALRDSSAALQMLALARDEAHRTSNALRESVGRRRRLASDLDRVPGIGP
ncbi:MAG: excinuclease ABC subunit UvrC, partial [Myxococcales bacterium]|nr:excinuclease ABC subunit UvrC [Myxococcales bacterium]